MKSTRIYLSIFLYQEKYFNGFSGFKCSYITFFRVRYSDALRTKKKKKKYSTKSHKMSFHFLCLNIFTCTCIIRRQKFKKYCQWTEKKRPLHACELIMYCVDFIDPQPSIILKLNPLQYLIKKSYMHIFHHISLKSLHFFICDTLLIIDIILLSIICRMTH